MMMTHSRTESLIQKALSFAHYSETTVRLRWIKSGNTRFANNEPTTNGDIESLEMEVTSTVEGRSATVSGNAEDPEVMKKLVQESELLAKYAPIDPEHMPAVKPQSYKKVLGVDKIAAKMNADDRVKIVKTAIEVSKAQGVLGSGYLEHSNSVLAIGNRAGLFAYYPYTDIAMSMTCRTQDGTGSGRSAVVGYRSRDIDSKGLAERASAKALQSRSALRVKPGRYVVVLEAQAVADMFGFFYQSLTARPADEGRSFFSGKGGGNRIGEKIFNEKIGLSSLLDDKDAPTVPFTDDGDAFRSVRWIHKGVLENLGYSRFWANKMGKPVLYRPGSVKLSGEGLTLSQLLSKVDRGVLVTRFWYNRMLEPRSITLTGLTRDGTFWIEGGKVSHAIKNFRYNDSPVNLLKNVVATGVPQRVEGVGAMTVPPMVVDGFNFSSTSDAI